MGASWAGPPRPQRDTRAGRPGLHCLKHPFPHPPFLPPHFPGLVYHSGAFSGSVERKGLPWPVSPSPSFLTFSHIRLTVSCILPLVLPPLPPSLYFQAKALGVSPLTVASAPSFCILRALDWMSADLGCGPASSSNFLPTLGLPG